MYLPLQTKTVATTQVCPEKIPISSGQRCYWKSNQVQCAKEIYFWNQNIFLLLKSLYQPLVPLNYSNQTCRSYLHSSTSLISLIQLIKICRNELISLLYLDYFHISAKKQKKAASLEALLGHRLDDTVSPARQADGCGCMRCRRSTRERFSQQAQKVGAK